ncbi:hypothetical protein DXG03_002685 [Asterophora parasitica]|uniref:JmjC domain-containing protein n=1 Tax=Asterophora parasitica TaxID=117018 RepID=A0A9P7KFB7_9AGAR|nr:hypothetical protein DXG03_002685 [Asterophora parasitica]
MLKIGLLWWSILGDQQLIFALWLDLVASCQSKLEEITEIMSGRRTDIIVPDYVYASMQPPDFTAYKPPGNNERLLINMWLGPKGTISPAHTDPYYNIFEPSMTNTSRVDVFSAKSEEFRDFWTHVVPKATSAVLKPGDLLYIPPGWWHAMRSEETSFSVSMWF